MKLTLSTWVSQGAVEPCIAGLGKKATSLAERQSHKQHQVESEAHLVMSRKLAIAEDRIAELERQLGIETSFPACFRLTRTHQKILGLLLNRDVVSIDTIRTVLYDMSTYGKEEPDGGCVRTFICQIRQRLQVFGIEIRTVWGMGYEILPEHKRDLRHLSYEGAQPF